MYIKNLSKSFGDNIVLSNFNAELSDGEISCIMGKSGCGKSTLLNIIMGLVKADSGEISDFGRISAVFQEDRLCTRLNAITNIKLVCGKKVSEDSIIANLKAVGLTETDIIKPISELSGGMKRRAAIVRAIMAESDTIIMDEAFKGLDTETRQLTADYVLANRNERTIIAVTHDIDEVKLLDGRLIKMQED